MMASIQQNLVQDPPLSKASLTDLVSALSSKLGNTTMIPVADLTSQLLLTDILDQLRITNLHLQLITDMTILPKEVH